MNNYQFVRAGQFAVPSGLTYNVELSSASSHPGNITRSTKLIPRQPVLDDLSVTNKGKTENVYMDDNFSPSGVFEKNFDLGNVFSPEKLATSEEETTSRSEAFVSRAFHGPDNRGKPPASRAFQGTGNDKSVVFDRSKRATLESQTSHDMAIQQIDDVLTEDSLLTDLTTWQQEDLSNIARREVRKGGGEGYISPQGLNQNETDSDDEVQINVTVSKKDLKNNLLTLRKIVNHSNDNNKDEPLYAVVRKKKKKSPGNCNDDVVKIECETEAMVMTTALDDMEIDGNDMSPTSLISQESFYDPAEDPGYESLDSIQATLKQQLSIDSTNVVTNEQKEKKVEEDEGTEGCNARVNSTKRSSTDKIDINTDLIRSNSINVTSRQIKNNDIQSCRNKMSETGDDTGTITVVDIIGGIDVRRESRGKTTGEVTHVPHDFTRTQETGNTLLLSENILVSNRSNVQTNNIVRNRGTPMLTNNSVRIRDTRMLSNQISLEAKQTTTTSTDGSIGVGNKSSKDSIRIKDTAILTNNDRVQTKGLPTNNGSIRIKDTPISTNRNIQRKGTKEYEEIEARNAGPIKSSSVRIRDTKIKTTFGRAVSVDVHQTGQQSELCTFPVASDQNDDADSITTETSNKSTSSKTTRKKILGMPASLKRYFDRSSSKKETSYYPSSKHSKDKQKKEARVEEDNIYRSKENQSSKTYTKGS